MILRVTFVAARPDGGRLEHFLTAEEERSDRQRSGQHLLARPLTALPPTPSWPMPDLLADLSMITAIGVG